MQRDKPLPAPASAPYSGFMRDARTSGAAPRDPPADTTFVPQIRKLYWFQRHILCMKVDLYREQYMAYRRDTAISDSQRLILHHVTSSPGPPPAASPIDSYAGFCEGDYIP